MQCSIHTKRIVLSTLAAAVAMMFLAGLWHEIFMANFYKEQTHATHEGTGLIFLAYLSLAFLMVFLYSRISLSGSTIVKGIKFGIIIGLLWVFPHGLAMAGAHGESLVYLFKNTLWHIVEQGAGGVVIAWFFAGNNHEKVI